MNITYEEKSLLLSMLNRVETSARAEIDHLRYQLGGPSPAHVSEMRDLQHMRKVAKDLRRKLSAVCSAR